MTFEPLSLRAAILLGILLLGFTIWRLAGSRAGTAIRLSTLNRVTSRRNGVRTRLHRLPDAIRILSILILLFAFARPREGEESVFVSSEGVAIMMLVDRSSSMEEDMRYGAEQTTRLDAVKQVFQAFVAGSDEFPGRPGDIIGLSSFAGFVEHNCPLTLDHGTLVTFLENIQTASRIDDGTAIGDALRHATLTLITGTEKTGVKSRFIVLLSDGEQTAGELTPREGAQYAASNGIKVHCIFVADQSSRQRDFFGMLTPQPTGKELEEVARITGGTYSKATDGSTLMEIVRQLDRAEKTEISEKIVRFRERYEEPLLIALGLIMIELFLRATLFLRIP